MRALPEGLFITDVTAHGTSDERWATLRARSVDEDPALAFGLLGGGPEVFAVDGAHIYRRAGAATNDTEGSRGTLGTLVARPLDGGRPIPFARTVGRVTAIAVDADGVYYLDDDGFHAHRRADPVPTPAPILQIDPIPEAGPHVGASEAIAVDAGRLYWMGGVHNPGLWTSSTVGDDQALILAQRSPGEPKVRIAGGQLFFTYSLPEIGPALVRMRLDGPPLPPEVVPTSSGTRSGWGATEEQLLDLTPAWTVDAIDPISLVRQTLAVLEQSGVQGSWVEADAGHVYVPGPQGVWRFIPDPRNGGWVAPWLPRWVGQIRVTPSAVFLCGGPGGTEPEGPQGLYLVSPEGTVQLLREETHDCVFASDGAHVYRREGSSLVAIPLVPGGEPLVLAEGVSPVAIAVDADGVYFIEDFFGYREIHVLPR